MKRQSIKNNRGFTLVELILYIAIVSMFLTAVVNFGWNLVYGRVKTTIYQDINQNLRLASKRIVYEIRNASAINSVSASSISLANTDIARNPTVIDLSGGRIRIGYGSGGSCPTSNPCYLTSNNLTVSELSYINLSNSDTSNIKFLITIEKTGDRKEYNQAVTFNGSAEIRSQ